MLQKEIKFVKSVLGKLIQREFGRDIYASYTEKMNKKQSMDIFCDIYERLRHESSDDLNHALKNLLESVQVSIRISRNFLYIVMGFIVTILTLLLLELPTSVFVLAGGAVILCFGYKTVEFFRNRYCDRDIRIVLIYKIALFHLLEESCLQKEGHEL